jgi:hypothetical protein
MFSNHDFFTKQDINREDCGLISRYVLILNHDRVRYHDLNS